MVRMMTDRERFLATLTYEKPDRTPFMPGHDLPRKSTRAAWHKQGVPESVDDYFGHAARIIGIDPPQPASSQVQAGVDFRMIPRFKEKILERHPGDPERGTAGTLVVQDWKGNICKISDEYDPRYLREPIDFVTRSWIKCPVETRDDWEAMKERYVLEAPGRFPDDYAHRARILHTRDYPVGLVFPGPFWQLREWLGFENLCMLFLDDPPFVRDMIDFWDCFVTELLARIFEDFIPDFITINEDMAYKEKPMIGPGMSREFLLPCWRRWAELSRNAGVPILEVDSDGYVADLIPVWLEAGVNCNSPQEVAAGNDLPSYNRHYYGRMAFRGGVDKRSIAEGGQALRDEIERLRPAIDAGGYIPTCDHAVPSNVSWENFVDYCRLLAHATGWL